jgi:hypothetical protein
MTKRISDSFIAAKEITIAALANKTTGLSSDYGKDTAAFFEAVYEKLKDIEDKVANQ